MRCVIENIFPDRITGWAVNDEAFDEKLTVLLREGATLLHATCACNLRQDLKNNSLGDGRFGFTLLTHDRDYFEDLRSGKVKVQAQHNNGKLTTAVVTPAIIERRMAFDATHQLETFDFKSYLSHLSARAKMGFKAFDLEHINAARAHFPEWRLSEPFHKLALECARILGKPRTVDFYQTRLALGLIDVGPLLVRPVLGSTMTSHYGNGGILAPELRVRYVRPNAMGRPMPPSFMEETQLFQADEPSRKGEPEVRLLAYREYAYGEPTWFVLRQGKKHPAMRSLYYMDFEQLLEEMATGAILCIDMSNEGPEYDPVWNAVAHQAVSDLGLPRRQVLLVQQNLTYVQPEAQRPHFFGAMATSHYFLLAGVQALSQIYPDDAAIEQHIQSGLAQRAALTAQTGRHFICLNFTPRWHRWMVMLHLHARGWLARGHVSFPGGTSAKMKQMVDLDKKFTQLPWAQTLLAGLPAFLELCPLELDVQAGRRLTPLYEYPMPQMLGSLLHIVTESEMAQASAKQRVTEKIIKPIVGLQPFIVLGNAHSLRLLREMGFKTFSPWIDETYDEIEDPAQRAQAALAEIDRLLSQDFDVLQQQMAGLNEVVAHNFRHLLSQGQRLWGTEVENALREVLAAMARRVQVA